MRKTGRLARVRGIAPHEWGTLVRAWFALLLVDLGLRRLGLQRVQRWPGFRARAAPPRSFRPTPVELNRLFHLVAIAARHHLYPMLCLRRALVLQWLLAERGEPSEVCLGVARGTGGVDAHAWIEWEGQVIGEGEGVRERYAGLKRGGNSA